MRIYRISLLFSVLGLLLLLATTCRRNSLAKLTDSHIGFNPGKYKLELSFTHDITGVPADFVDPGGFDAILQRWFLFGDHPYKIHLKLFNQLGAEVDERFAQHLRFEFIYESEDKNKGEQPIEKFLSYTYENRNTRKALNDILWFEDKHRYFKTLFTLPEPFKSKDKYETSGDDEEQRIPARLRVRVYYAEDFNDDKAPNYFPKGKQNSIFLCETTAHILVNSISDGYIKVENWSVNYFSTSVSDLAEILRRRDNIGIGKYYTDLPELGPENEYPSRFSIYLGGKANTRHERYKVRMILQKQPGLDEVPPGFAEIPPGQTVPKSLIEDITPSPDFPTEAIDILGTQLLNGQPVAEVKQGGDGKLVPSANITTGNFGSNDPLFKPSVSIPKPNAQPEVEINSTDLSLFFPKGVRDFKKLTGVYKAQLVAQRVRDNKEIRSKVYYLNFIDLLQSFRFRHSKEIWKGEKQEDPNNLSGIVARKNHERYISSNSFLQDIDKKIYKDQEMYFLDMPKLPAGTNGNIYHPIKITFTATGEQPGDEDLIHLYGRDFEGNSEKIIQYEWGKAYYCIAKEKLKNVYYAVSELYADIDKNGKGRQAKIAVHAKIEFDNPSPDDQPFDLDLGNITRVFVGTRLDGKLNTAAYTKNAEFDNNPSHGHPQYWFENGYTNEQEKDGNLARWSQKTLRFTIKKPGSDDHFQSINATTTRDKVSVYAKSGALTDGTDFKFDKDKIKKTIKNIGDAVTLNYSNLKWKDNSSNVYVFIQKATCQPIGNGLKNYKWNNGWDQIKMDFTLFKYGHRVLPEVITQETTLPTTVIEWDGKTANSNAFNQKINIPHRPKQDSKHLFKCEEFQGKIYLTNADDRAECVPSFLRPWVRRTRCNPNMLIGFANEMLGTDLSVYNNLDQTKEIYDGPNKLKFTKNNDPNSYLGVYNPGILPKSDESKDWCDNEAFIFITRFFDINGKNQMLKGSKATAPIKCPNGNVINIP